jgi:hypothetical protein
MYNRKKKKMYNLYEVNFSGKTDIIGIWQDNNTGKVYFDNIKIINCNTIDSLTDNIINLFDMGEKAVFYTDNNYAYIKYKETGKKDILKNRKILWRKKLSIKEIKELLKKYGGMTIFNDKLGHRYIIDIRY